MALIQNPSADNKASLNSYRDLGIIHLLSTSGLYVSLYILGIMWLRTVTERIEEEVILCCVASLIIEILLSNFQAGFVRASLSHFRSVFFNREKIMISNGDKLGIVVLSHLISNLLLFLDSGTILSYLLIFELEISENSGKIRQNTVLNSLVVPTLLNNLYRVNFLIVIYNFLIVPIFSFIFLPLIFIVVFSFWCLSTIVELSEPILKGFADLTNFIADKRWGLVTFGQVGWLQTISLLVVAVSLITLPKHKILKLKLRSIIAGAYANMFSLIHFPLKRQASFIDAG